MADIRVVAALLDGEVISTHQVAFPLPGKPLHDRSCEIALAPERARMFEFTRRSEYRSRAVQEHVISRIRPYLDPTDDDLDIHPERFRALRFWYDSKHPKYTPVDEYFRSRFGIFPHGPADVAIRFHPEFPFQGEEVPCMVALVRDPFTDFPVGIHCTALTDFGEQAFVGGIGQMTLGPVYGGVIKMAPGSGAESNLVVGEGLETTFRLNAAVGSAPIWVCLSAEDLGRFRSVPEVETLTIAVHGDSINRDAGKRLADRYVATGRNVVLAYAYSQERELSKPAAGKGEWHSC